MHDCVSNKTSMKIKIGKLGRTWYNIIKLDLEEIGRQDVYYIHLQLHWLHCTCVSEPS